MATCDCLLNHGSVYVDLGFRMSCKSHGRFSFVFLHFLELDLRNLRCTLSQTASEIYCPEFDLSRLRYSLTCFSWKCCRCPRFTRSVPCFQRRSSRILEVWARNWKTREANASFGSTPRLPLRSSMSLLEASTAFIHTRSSKWLMD